MGKNKHLRDLIKGNEAQVALHEEKLAKERAKPQPDSDLIYYWEKETRKFQRLVEKYSDKLPGGRR